MAGSSHSCTLRTPPSRPITHCVHMRTQLLPVSYTACTFARSEGSRHGACGFVITLLTPP